MSENSAIEWTDSTWNPVTGCTKVSPGCANCYIERTPPFRMQGRQFVNGTTGVRLHPERLEQPLRWRKPRRVFVCSLADLFHDDVPDTYLRCVLSVAASASQHTFQILTKRPERMRDFFASHEWRCGQFAPIAFVGGRSRSVPRFIAPRSREGGDPMPAPPPNVWLGVSIENARHTWRADVLREIPAVVRFLSCEPLLGSLYPAQGERGIATSARGSNAPHASSALNDMYPSRRAPLDLSGIDWVIAGGESGPGARPMHPDWAREIRDACLARKPSCSCYPGMCPMGCEPACPYCNSAWSRPAFFFKQWGSWAPAGFVSMLESGSRRAEVAYGGEPPRGSRSPFVTYWRGNSGKSGGRTLDGRTWDEFPTSRATR